jgi:CubicO group peptidase (beta-lactamase class C family)
MTTIIYLARQGYRVADAEYADSAFSALAPNVAKAVQAHGFSTLRVLREGETVVAVGPQDRPLPISSIRKSIISGLFGLLFARGVVQLNTTLAELGIDESPRLTDEERSATLRHLLTSSSGICLPLCDGAAAYDIFRNRPSEWPKRGSAAPGSQFHYSNWDFNVLGEIYQRVSGLALFTAIDGLLARPLGFRDWNPLDHARLRYGCDALGATPRYPNYAMQLSARDLARFGQLYLNGGTWSGDVIVPLDWVRESTQTRVGTGLPSPFQSYGYLWWTTDSDDPTGLPAESFSAIGFGGQIVSVIPSRQTVIVAQRQNHDSRSVQMALPADLIDAVIER